MSRLNDTVPCARAGPPNVPSRRALQTPSRIALARRKVSMRPCLGKRIVRCGPFGPANASGEEAGRYRLFCHAAGSPSSLRSKQSQTVWRADLPPTNNVGNPFATVRLIRRPEAVHGGTGDGSTSTGPARAAPVSEVANNPFWLEERNVDIRAGRPDRASHQSQCLAPGSHQASFFLENLPRIRKFFRESCSSRSR